MGFSPQQVDAMSIWQWSAALAGFIKANSPNKERLTESEKDDLFAWLEPANSNGRELSTIVYDWGPEGFTPIGKVWFTV